MKKILLLIICLILSFNYSKAQKNDQFDSLIKNYRIKQEKLNKSFSEYFYGNFKEIYSFKQSKFENVIDSLQNLYTDFLESFLNENPIIEEFFKFQESKEIQYYFENLKLDYLYQHKKNTGEEVKLVEPNENIKKDFTNPEMMNVESFVSYVKTYLYFLSKIELENSSYASIDNQQLNATLNIIPQYFSNSKIKEYLMFDYLYNHIDNFGIKNIEKNYQNFINTCHDTVYINQVSKLYEAEKKGRQGHLIETYKTVGNFKLDIHLFLPDSSFQTERNPVIVYFHGGSWSEGKPDWSFGACQKYSEKSWVGVAVEYRLADRHGTLPFEAVMDAKSAIRWLRVHANEYNIDTNRIVASGNSAGGHLILATALVENWNEKTDNLNINPVPNLLMVYSGVYDLTDSWWIKQGLKNRNLDENLVKEISPNYLSQNKLPPTLIIHGTDDNNVPFSTAQQFVNVMEENGNNIEFHVLEGAGHFIWYDRRYNNQVDEIRTKFLEKQGYLY
ncbi:MAG: hypothetical protein A2041_00650 [Bacteroidetes bacterium GWA2_31_9b]|nr:MAG: hypothetical protein A2041_00650 [Bacteroidetes bacterium GWA2_31_9b]